MSIFINVYMLILVQTYLKLNQIYMLIPHRSIESIRLQEITRFSFFTWLQLAICYKISNNIIHKLMA